jgi:uncharacterized protein (DUF1697 family)
MPVFISLLRGINVGGNKKIAMAELRAVYESLGLAGARTLLQSGNIIFRADGEGETLAMLTGRIENAIEAHFGFHVAVIMRTRDDLDGIITEQPFSAGQLAEPSKIAVAFLAETPTAAALVALNEDHDGPEIIHSQGRELYIYYTEGMGRSKLTNNFIENRLNTTSTVRNWNTINKLHALALSFDTPEG